MSEGIVHRHDRRVCWDCRGLGIVARSISQPLTDQALHAIGWRFLEPGGRMVCPNCAQKRRQMAVLQFPPEPQEDIPF